MSAKDEVKKWMSDIFQEVYMPAIDDQIRTYKKAAEDAVTALEQHLAEHHAPDFAERFANLARAQRDLAEAREHVALGGESYNALSVLIMRTDEAMRFLLRPYTLESHASA